MKLLEYFDYKKIVRRLILPLNLLLILFFYLDYINYFPPYWKFIYVFYIILITDTIYLLYRIKDIPIEERENSSIVFFIKYFFILLLLILAINQFIKKEILLSFIDYIILTSISTGLLTYYSVNENIEKDLFIERIKKNKKYDQPINNIDKNKISFKKNFFRFNIKSNLFYYLLLSILVLIILISYLPNLGTQYLWSDEVFSFHAAERIISTGKPIYETGLNYNGASIYHYLLSLSMILFGINEFGSRVINIILIVFTIILIYFIFKDINKRIGIFACFLLIITNFELAMARETRFYVLLSFIFLSSIFAYYNAFINEKKLNKKIIIFNTKFEYNPIWSLIFIIFYYIAYKISPLSVFFIFGLFLYHLVSLLKYNSKKKDLIYTLFLIFLIFSITYYQFKTFNLYNAYTEKTTLDWAINNNLNTHYYTDLLKTNLPYYYLGLILFIIFFIISKNKLINLLNCILLISLIVISYQKQLQERYLYMIIPLIVILISYYYYYYLHIFRKNKFLKFVFIIIILIMTLSQLLLFFKEVKEIQNYKSTSISQHKKFEFNKVFIYLNNSQNHSIIIADWHSAFTLIENNYPIDYILLDKNNINLQYGDKDPYFNTTYLVYESKEFKELIKKENIIFIIRDDRNFNNIYKYLKSLSISNKPKIFIVETKKFN